ncbi:hypothetical protein ENUP19_0366G0007 [Entamoeba nuttalli]|uniref:Viral A-type inclusion protein n=1 Tax=Entamoeba nuttalli TaxID=412467 RepID=A0ABQ0DYN0_9EUKA
MIEEENNQYNPIEIKDNRIYNNCVMSIENEDNDDQDSTKVETKVAEEKKRLVEKEEENNKKEKRIKEIEEKEEENMKEKEEMKKEIQIQIKDQTINKLTNDIMALKKKHENEISTKNHECDKKIFKFNAESDRKMFELNNLTQQLLFLKDKLSKLENENTKEEKKKDEVTYNITDSSETQIVNNIFINMVVADKISSCEDDLQKKES